MNKNEEQDPFEFQDSLDAYAFSKVEAALKREPDFHLPANFSDRVMAKIEAGNNPQPIMSGSVWVFSHL